MTTTETRKPKPMVPVNTISIRNIKKTPPPKDVSEPLMKIYTVEHIIDYNYVELLKEDKTIINLHQQKCRLNVIISAYHRDTYIKVCIKALEHAMRFSDMMVKITIIQIEDVPTLQYYANNKDIDYIFLNIEDIKTKGVFSKALAYDIAYLLSCNMSPTTLFQDCDLIVTEDFFKVLDQYHMDKLSWLQAFAKKCVIPIHYEDTVKIFNNIIPIDELTDFLHEKNPFLTTEDENENNYMSNNAGACGGSILIDNKLYEQVGGMDPEVCYGYGVEDAMLWTKLITTKKTVNRVTTVHQTDGQYADGSKPIYQYHLYHPTLSTQNPLYRIMADMHMEFLRSRHVDKKSYVDMKREQFAEQKKNVQESSLV